MELFSFNAKRDVDHEKTSLRRLLFVICGIGALARLIFCASLERLQQPEIWEYEEIAMNLVRGNGFVFFHLNTIYRSFCEPLYPGLCAVIYLVFGHEHFIVVLLQIVLSILAIAIVTVWTKKMTEQRAVTYLAGIIGVVHPGLLMYNTKLHPLLLDSLLFVLVVWSAFRYSDKPTTGRSFLVGLVSGVCFLSRPTIIVAMPVVWWWLWISEKSGMVKIRLERGIVTFVTMVAVASPWLIRNYQIHDEFMLTRSITPFVLWLGNNPYASGAAVDKHGRDVFFAVVPEDFRENIIAAGSETAQNQMFANLAREYIVADPWGFCTRFIAKFSAFWWFWPYAGQYYSDLSMTIYRVWWLMLAGAGVYGIYCVNIGSYGFKNKYNFLLAIALCVSLAQSVFFVEGRHRLAIEPLLFSISAFGISQFRRWFVVSFRGFKKLME